MKKVYYIKPMACKEYANKYHPELVIPERFCPFNFGLSVMDFNNECDISHCESCWKQPAKYHGKWIMKVKVINNG